MTATAITPTPGAMRAAREIAAGFGVVLETKDAQEIAAIIDRETGNRELLAAARNALNVLAGLATSDLLKIRKDSPAIAQLRAAIARAEGC